MSETKQDWVEVEAGALLWEKINGGNHVDENAVIFRVTGGDEFKIASTPNGLLFFRRRNNLPKCRNCGCQIQNPHCQD